MGRFANIDTWDPAVNVTNWLLVVVAGLSVLIRLGTKLWIFQRLTSDDYLIIAALVRRCLGRLSFLAGWLNPIAGILHRTIGVNLYSNRARIWIPFRDCFKP